MPLQQLQRRLNGRLHVILAFCDVCLVEPWLFADDFLVAFAAFFSIDYAAISFNVANPAAAFALQKARCHYGPFLVLYDNRRQAFADDAVDTDDRNVKPYDLSRGQRIGRNNNTVYILLLQDIQVVLFLLLIPIRIAKNDIVP
ncbi:hypothetical protein D3C77_501010 [compost metagenome]